MVLFAGKPAAGIWLRAYADSSTQFKGKAQSQFGPTAADGRFRLDLNPGRYYLIGGNSRAGAVANDPGTGDLFGYYGGNPVRIAEGTMAEVHLQFVKRKAVSILRNTSSDITISGTIEGPRGPEAGAVLLVYPDAGKDFRGPDIFGPLGSNPDGTGPDGRFSLDLPPGTYYFVAAKRKGGTALGPLQVGDLYGYFDGNPLQLQLGQKVDLTVSMTEKLRPQEQQAGAAPGTTGIQGRILDPTGRPLAGVFAFATTDASLFGTMPPYHSRRVGADGVFFIELPDAGTFYVGARTGIGGPPQPGEWQGMLGGLNPRAIRVKKGKLVDGVEITVRVVE